MMPVDSIASRPAGWGGIAELKADSGMLPAIAGTMAMTIDAQQLDRDIMQPDSLTLPRLA